MCICDTVHGVSHMWTPSACSVGLWTGLTRRNGACVVHVFVRVGDFLGTCMRAAWILQQEESDGWIRLKMPVLSSSWDMDDTSPPRNKVRVKSLTQWCSTCLSLYLRLCALVHTLFLLHLAHRRGDGGIAAVKVKSMLQTCGLGHF